MQCKNRVFLRNQVRYKSIQFVISVIGYEVTSRERPKSALYVRLKIVEGGPLGFVKLQLVAKYEKKGGPLGNFEKNPKINLKRFLNSVTQSHSAEKCKSGDPLGFFDIHYVVKYRNKRRGDLLAESKKKSHSAEKNPSEKHQREGSYAFEVLDVDIFVLFWTRFWRFEYVLDVRSSS